MGRWGRRSHFIDKGQRASHMALVVKNPPTIAGDIRDAGLIPGSGRYLGGGHGNPLQYPCLENPHGQRSLAGYSPCGCKKSDITEAIEHACTYKGQSQAKSKCFCLQIYALDPGQAASLIPGRRREEGDQGWKEAGDPCVHVHLSKATPEWSP